LVGLGLLLASCSTSASIEETTTSPTTPPPTSPPATLPGTTTTTSTTTTLPPTTTTTTSTTTTLPPTTTTTPLPDIDAEILIPDGDGPFPAVVLVHGGGWVGGSPSLMRPLATHLTNAGFLTVNTRYKLSNDRPGYPDAMSDVACAVRYAAAHPDSDGTVAVVGHSAGAHISAVVALTGDDYTERCEIAGTGVPERLVGLAGPYDVLRLGPLMIPFFGTGPANDPDAWFAGNPMNLTGQNTDLDSLLMHGDRDGLVDYSFTRDFDEALEDGGSRSLIEIVEGASHMDMHDPGYVGDLIIVWLGG
jgi:acetyl esterase/lipase